MRYRSTRDVDSAQKLTFEQALFEGLAPDGGLYIPEAIPQVPLSKILSWANLSYSELALEIFRLYIDESEISVSDLADIVERSYATFTHKDITPLVKLPNVASEEENARSHHNLENLYVLELFHGPTCAFKDVALQFVGNAFEYFLKRRNQNKASPSDRDHRITVVGATSGDTGGAAIYGLRGKENVSVFILHPKGRISPVQEQQMTSVLDDNVFNIAVEGSFDDCQDIVKALFSDLDFKKRFQLGAVNSINWARIMAQITYYFYSYFALLKAKGVPLDTASYAVLTKIRFSVPTGNFGDILAGYFALRMGLPIDRLIIATNENDILHRFLETGSYTKPTTTCPVSGDLVRATLSPAMDILISSNFERLLWYLANGDGRTPAESPDAQAASEAIREWMSTLKSTGGFSVPETVLERARQVFDSVCVSNADTTDAIKRYYHHQYSQALDQDQLSNPTLPAGARSSYVLDPHTAVGVVAAERILLSDASIGSAAAVNVVCLSTASPGKFPEAVLTAINESVPTESTQLGFVPVEYRDIAPQVLVDLEGLPKRCIFVETEGGNKAVGEKAIRHILEEKVGAGFV
ncbi:threonine synthase [Polychytrium aggregatum]|uniref:threonine synthase n=1 Tax=Polychytrium aggregatum TaxID=110093 RepID=UPI0022FEF32E|nr:threonine synthase [Polychytrium aggregatum]KAI9202541.1 threonine synthase [Polychytrium aggregatum]